MTIKENLPANFLTAEQVDNVTPRLERLRDSMRKSAKKHSKEKKGS
jgi:hypothetical protein